MKKKSLILALALVLAMTFVIGGTIAWLTANSDEVKNVFTTSDIGVDLTENTGDEYTMIPGWTLDKDPAAMVDEESVDCYLFITVEEGFEIEGYAFGDYLDYEIVDTWIQLTDKDGNDVENVYYMIFNESSGYTKGEEYPILVDDEVVVLDSVTKAMMEAAEGNEPTLTFNAYVSQMYKSEGEAFEPYEAWDNVKP